jgi:hypothetical protein
VCAHPSALCAGWVGCYRAIMKPPAGVCSDTWKSCQTAFRITSASLSSAYPTRKNEMSEWEEQRIRDLRLQKLQAEQGQRMRAELSKLGPILFFLVRLCVILTVNGAALSVLIWLGEVTCSLFDLHLTVPYAITHLVGASHPFPIPQHGLVYSYGSSLMSGLFKVPPTWGGYTAFSYVCGWFAVGFVFAIVIPVGAGITLYHYIIGADPVGFTKALGLACASVVGIGLFSINTWSGIAIIAMIIAPGLRLIINFFLKRANSERRMGYWQAVALVLAYVVFRKRLSKLA